MSAEEEYEPINDGAVGDSYVPATAGGTNQSEEYTPMTNGTTNEDSYKPSVAFIQSNYVSCFEQKNGTDSGFDKQSSESSSGKHLSVIFELFKHLNFIFSLKKLFCLLIRHSSNGRK